MMTTSSCKASETDAPSSPHCPPNGLTWVSPESMIPVSAPDYGQLRLLWPMPLTVQADEASETGVQSAVVAAAEAALALQSLSQPRRQQQQH
ncbi:unnamed protein product [Lota lota]